MHSYRLSKHREAAIGAAVAVGLTLAISGSTLVSAERARPDTTCNKSTYCVTDSNTGTGGAFHGISAKGTGIEGSTSATNGDSAVSGIASGTSGQGSGVYGRASAGFGVTGIIGGSAGVGEAGVIGKDLTNSGFDYGVIGSSTDGWGTYGYASSGVGLGGESAGVSSGSVDYAAIRAIADTKSTYMFIGSSSSSGQVKIDASGNITTTGEIYTSGNCKSGCAKTRDGERRVVSYAPHETVPTMEDTGEATLRNGAAHVTIDAALANVVNTEEPYIVLLTPEGDAALYVANR